MTRRICSGCGHTLVQPTSDVGGVMGAHMAAHTARHVQRGEASWWVIDATPEPRPLLRALGVLLASVVALLGTAADDAYRACAEITRTGRHSVRAGGTAAGLSVPQSENNDSDIR